MVFVVVTGVVIIPLAPNANVFDSGVIETVWMLMKGAMNFKPFSIGMKFALTKSALPDDDLA
jgi:hypothetical protein